jgi:hypothetical protein
MMESVPFEHTRHSAKPRSAVSWRRETFKMRLRSVTARRSSPRSRLDIGVTGMPCKRDVSCMDSMHCLNGTWAPNRSAARVSIPAALANTWPLAEMSITLRPSSSSGRTEDLTGWRPTIAASTSRGRTSLSELQSHRHVTSSCSDMVNPEIEMLTKVKGVVL